jgi:aminopeptidase N
MKFTTAATILASLITSPPTSAFRIAQLGGNVARRRSVASAAAYRRHHQVAAAATSFTTAATTTTTTTNAAAFHHHHPRGLKMMPLSLRGGGGGSSSSSSSSSALFSSTTAATTAEATTTPKEIFRKDYTPLPYLVSNVSMNFDIRDGETIVTSELTIVQNDKEEETATTTGSGGGDDLVLDGEADALTLLSITLDDKELVEGVDYTIEGDTLTIPSVLLPKKSSKKTSILKTSVKIIPEDNTQLSGLYKSGTMYCTQCEAMGFRRITYYPDRPDNMAIFDSVRIEANKEDYPVLLSNGNKLDSGDIIENDDDNTPIRHYATWKDPFPKPSYLFCIVAGNLGSISGSYTTQPSGRKVHLEVFSEHDNVSKLGHALESLKKSMKWDEEEFGLEYDLDIYNVVAVNDFNMGASEYLY